MYGFYAFGSIPLGSIEVPPQAPSPHTLLLLGAGATIPLEEALPLLVAKRLIDNPVVTRRRLLGVQ